MSNISYNSDELTSLFSKWDTIMGIGDDKKSHSIYDGVFQSILQKCKSLIELSESIHILVMQIESQSDSIYQMY